jgi:uncharacterized protein (TIGR03663 family)
LGKKRTRAGRKERPALSNRNVSSVNVKVSAPKRAEAAIDSGTNHQRVRPEISARAWRLTSLLILAGATLLRLYAWDENPLHHDEGVNGFFLMNLVRNGVYHYDPANYHGPTLYYFALLSQYIFGLNTFAIRFVPALFGIATVGLILCLRHRIGMIGALSAAALVAVSPGAVYMSRYFIHESLFVFFTLGTLVAALRYYETSREAYLLLAVSSAALLFATKETAMISAGVLLIALIATRIYMQFFTNAFAFERRSKRTDSNERLARFGGARRVALLAFGAAALFLFINVLFYSSFFTYSKGLTDAVETFKFWTRTGTKEHVHEWSAYLVWLWQEEAMTLLLGAAGVCVALWRARNSFAVFNALWAAGILSAYSLVPYKTPWLTLNFIVPLAIIGGYFVNEFYVWCNSDNKRSAALALAGVALAAGLYQSLTLNFRHYDDDAYPYVYAHTRRETLALVDEIKRLARRAGTNQNTAIAFVSPDYWPLPWYLRDYQRVGYHVRIPTPSSSSEPIIVCNETQEAELRATLGDAYTRVGAYVLRPGLNLVIYARRELLN